MSDAFRPLVTAAQLAAVFPTALQVAADRGYLGNPLEPVAAELCAVAPRAGITRLVLAHFLAQVRQEAGPALVATVESLAYSPEALVATFGYYRQRRGEAIQDGYARGADGRICEAADQRTIACKAYGGRLGNGPPESGDGWLYRGRGYIQMTGRATYARVQDACRQLWPTEPVDLLAHPEAAETMPWSLRTAIAWWLAHDLVRIASAGDSPAVVDRVTAVVNRDTDSYAARRANFRAAWAALSL